MYDYLVTRRQKKVHDAAVKSAAIVSSLFPKEIRDRLYEVNEEKDDPKKISGVGSGKKMLKGYLGDDDKENGNDDLEDSQTGAQGIPEVYDTKPIADLFPRTTVMFADIAGFTAWSSVREPTQVFTLLETVYRAFDGVFYCLLFPWLHTYFCSMIL